MARLDDAQLLSHVPEPATALVLATFRMRGMVALRLTAIASNVAFIAYGVSAGIDPVLLLHVLLLPLNALRLAQESKAPQVRDAIALAPDVPAAGSHLTGPDAARRGADPAALACGARTPAPPAITPRGRGAAGARLRSTS